MDTWGEGVPQKVSNGDLIYNSAHSSEGRAREQSNGLELPTHSTNIQEYILVFQIITSHTLPAYKALFLYKPSYALKLSSTAD